MNLLSLTDRSSNKSESTEFRLVESESECWNEIALFYTNACSTSSQSSEMIKWSTYIDKLQNKNRYTTEKKVQNMSFWLLFFFASSITKYLQYVWDNNIDFGSI